MMRNVACLLVAIAVCVPTIARTTAAADDGAAIEDMLSDRVLGDPDAPVTIVEYSSFTCPHCATFHAETLPEIKETYIDEGTVNLIFRDFPLDGRALAASMLTRCVDPARYYGFVELLFSDREAWATAPDIRRALMVRAKLAGMSEDAFDACLNNDALAQAINERAVRAGEERGIQSTPTYFVNDRRIRGAVPFEQFRTVIEDALSDRGAGTTPASGPAEDSAADGVADERGAEGAGDAARDAATDAERDAGADGRR